MKNKLFIERLKLYSLLLLIFSFYVFINTFFHKVDFREKNYFPDTNFISGWFIILFPLIIVVASIYGVIKAIGLIRISEIKEELVKKHIVVLYVLGFYLFASFCFNQNNFIFYNYYGINKTYDIDGYYVTEPTKAFEIYNGSNVPYFETSLLNKNQYSYSEDKFDFISRKKYVFEKATYIDGYVNNNFSAGYLNFMLDCLVMFFEKLLFVLSIYFVPGLLFITIHYFYINKRK